MSEPNAAAPAPTPGGGGGKLLPIMLVLNTALLGGVLVFVMKKQAPAPVAAKPAVEGEAAAGEGKEGEEGKGVPEGPGFMVKLENFIIQLKAVDTERYVRVAFDIELRSEPDKDLIAKNMPKIRDVIIAYFSDRTLDELRGSEGMARIKAAILERIDSVVPKKVKGIYLTDFIVQ